MKVSRQRIDEIALKVDNGGETLNYQDMQDLIETARTATRVLHLIQLAANTAQGDFRSINNAIMAIKDVLDDYSTEDHVASKAMQLRYKPVGVIYPRA